MTGLEKILKSISDEAEGLAEKTISRAKNNAQEILERSKSEAENKAFEIIKESEEESLDIISRAMTGAEKEKKKRILKTKQKHINDLIDQAKGSIERLPDDDYFTVILKMIEKFSNSGKGEIVLSKKDKDRLPSHFSERLARIANFKGGSLKISDENRDIQSGFVLVYGGVEENCSLGALFDSAHDKLCDLVNELLFL